MKATQKRGNVWASIFLSLLETILVTSEIKYFLFPKNILKIFYSMSMKDKILMKD